MQDASEKQCRIKSSVNQSVCLSVSQQKAVESSPKDNHYSSEMYSELLAVKQQRFN